MLHDYQLPRVCPLRRRKVRTRIGWRDIVDVGLIYWSVSRKCGHRTSHEHSRSPVLELPTHVEESHSLTSKITAFPWYP